MRLLHLDALKEDGCICIFSQLVVISSSTIYRAPDSLGRTPPPMHEYRFYLADTVRDRNLLSAGYVYRFSAGLVAGAGRPWLGYRPVINLSDVRLAVNLFDSEEVE